MLDGIDGAVKQFAGVLFAFLFLLGQSNLQSCLLRSEFLLLLAAELVVDLAPHGWVVGLVCFLLPVLDVALYEAEPQRASILGNVWAVSFDLSQLLRVFDFLQNRLQDVKWKIPNVDDQIDAALQAPPGHVQ